ncbi:hypothetical protein [Spirochaeta lutea]|uniref:Uncharacterized protein n=1 Tax=Spirochaeta lutea TaxID=1480694 RepID=A0A098R1T7_9SPIO|nr:hypothetical protein [Spirochaeta lutea]KGE72677.1 hypothetical protein DC28_06400 [Spirochaeta lutea]
MNYHTIYTKIVYSNLTAKSVFSDSVAYIKKAWKPYGVIAGLLMLVGVLGSRVGFIARPYNWLRQTLGDSAGMAVLGAVMVILLFVLDFVVRILLEIWLTKAAYQDLQQPNHAGMWEQIRRSFGGVVKTTVFGFLYLLKYLLIPMVILIFLTILTMVFLPIPEVLAPSLTSISVFGFFVIAFFIGLRLFMSPQITAVTGISGSPAIHLSREFYNHHRKPMRIYGIYYALALLILGGSSLLNLSLTDGIGALDAVGSNLLQLIQIVVSTGLYTFLIVVRSRILRSMDVENPIHSEVPAAQPEAVPEPPQG